jgi:predicted metal-dependent enzyme (double-stranded beta helix superfamily)
MMDVAQEGRSRFATFLSALAAGADEHGDNERRRLPGVIGAVRSLIAFDDWLDDEFAEPDPVRYRQYLLYCDPQRRFSVVSFVWGPGQSTPIHDHTTWGVIGMLRGAEISEGFEIQDGRPIASLQERLEPGQVAAVSPTLGDIHRVRNAYEDRASVSIHVYGGDIGAIERHVYPPEGGVKSFVSGYSNQRLPNVWGTA